MLHMHLQHVYIPTHVFPLVYGFLAQARSKELTDDVQETLKRAEEERLITIENERAEAVRKEKKQREAQLRKEKQVRRQALPN